VKEQKPSSRPSSTSLDSIALHQAEPVERTEEAAEPPSLGSTPPAAEPLKDADPNPDPPSDRGTLEDELGTADFALRGWFRHADLADYLAHLVDGRTTGLLATGDPNVFARVAALASVVKAAARWFALDNGPIPAFVIEAEKETTPLCKTLLQLLDEHARRIGGLIGYEPSNESPIRHYKFASKADFAEGQDQCETGSGGVCTRRCGVFVETPARA
jgi:hypothetical protein